MGRPDVQTAIVGGGPAGLAPLVAASRAGTLDALLDAGLAIVERGPSLGAGRLGRYAITSDSTAETFLTAVGGHADPRLGQLLADPLCRRFAALGRAAVPLYEAGRLMDMIGGILTDAIGGSGGAVLTGHEALDGQLGRDGTWNLRLRRCDDGAIRHVSAAKLLLATGGVQDGDDRVPVTVAGRALLPAFAGRLMRSDDMLRPEGLARLRARLAGAADPRVAILGGSTSALAAAGLLLRTCADLLQAPRSIVILHRRPLRVFYPSAAEARADGYGDFGPDDICPVSGFVYRLAGFRLDSRELVMRLLGVGGRAPEPRVALKRIGVHPDDDLHRCLDEADVVVAATGYRPQALPLRDAGGEPIRLRGCVGPEPLVDAHCRVCDAEGRPVDNLFGIGLAAGFVPRGAFGGEPSFRGQANGLWLWQTAVGSMIVDHLLAGRPDPSAASTEPAVSEPARPWSAALAFSPG